VAILRLADLAKIFYNGCPELHAEDATWNKFKGTLRERFRDVHMGQFHFTNLQTARQKKNESPQDFAEHCRALAQKIIYKTDDPTAQRIHHKNADQLLLASFISASIGEPGRRVRYRNTKTLQQALTIVLSIYSKQRNKGDSMKAFTPG